MSEVKQTYVAQYLAHHKLGEWCQAGEMCPRYQFKAMDDKEALDIALSFAKKPMMYAAGIRKRVPVPNAVYTLSNLYKLSEVELTRNSPRKRLEVCIGKDDFNFFV